MCPVMEFLLKHFTLFYYYEIIFLRLTIIASGASREVDAPLMFCGGANS
jgi:hypothetical protein